MLLFPLDRAPENWVRGATNLVPLSLDPKYCFVRVNVEFDLKCSVLLSTWFQRWEERTAIEINRALTRAPPVLIVFIAFEMC